MNPTQKTLLASIGVIAAVVVAALAVKYSAGGSPIEVGDGSITLQYKDGVNKSDHRIEVYKSLHKVKAISIGDYGGSLGSPMDVSGREWTLTSDKTPQFQLSLRTHTGDLGKGVVATCTSPAAWTGSGTSYICTVGTHLTPVTITFSDGDCPGTSSPSCGLTCPSGKCLLQLEYK